LITFEEKGFVVDWIDYYESALKEGMKSERILNRMRFAITDAYGKEYSNIVMRHMEEYLK
tara:strand:+ start:18129 stop:18308 length:180 start_codon:yes stop_codon:yes gene_type:complete